MNRLKSTLYLLSLALLAGCEDQKPVATYTYTFEAPTGDARALGSLADKNNFDTMEEPDYNQAAALDPFNTVDSDFYLNNAPLGSVYMPTTLYRAPGT